MYEEIAFIVGCVSGFIALALLAIDFYLLYKVKTVESRLEQIRDCLVELCSEVRESNLRKRSGDQTRRVCGLSAGIKIYSQLSPEIQRLADQGYPIQTLLEEESRIRAREIHRIRTQTLFYRIGLIDRKPTLPGYLTGSETIYLSSVKTIPA